MEDKLPDPLHKQWHWVDPVTDRQIQAAWEDIYNADCQLCQETFDSTRELKTHMNRHYTVTLCPCGEHSFDEHYIPCHQQTASCCEGAILLVNDPNFLQFYALIRPLMINERHLLVLSQGFPSTQFLAPGPVPEPDRTRPPTKLAFTCQPRSHCPVAVNV